MGEEEQAEAPQLASSAILDQGLMVADAFAASSREDAAGPVETGEAEVEEKDEIVPVGDSQSRASGLATESEVVEVATADAGVFSATQPTRAAAADEKADRTPEQAYASLRYENEVPSPDQWDDVIAIIDRKRTDALIDADYDEAAVQEELCLVLQRRQMEQEEAKGEGDVDAWASHAREEDEARLRQLQDALQRANERFAEDLAENERQRQGALERVGEENEEELDQFRSYWSDPERVQSWARPSPALIQMRHCERKLAIGKLYDQAKRVKENADEQQRIEEVEAQSRMTAAAWEAYRTLRVKQRRKLDTVNNVHDRRAIELQVRSRLVITRIERQIGVVEQKMRDVGTRAQFQAKMRVLPAAPKDLGASRRTPRTRQKLRRYKEQRPGQIRVAPLTRADLARMSDPFPGPAGGKGVRARTSGTSGKRLPSLAGGRESGDSVA